jgi:hypothetical protein
VARLGLSALDLVALQAPSNQRTRRNIRLMSHFHQAIRCLSGRRHCPCNTTRANNLLKWAVREILGALPLEEHIEGDNRELFSMAVGSSPRRSKKSEL